MIRILAVLLTPIALILGTAVTERDDDNRNHHHTSPLVSSDTLHVFPAELSVRISRWINTNPTASLEETTDQANFLLNQHGWDISFGFSSMPFPGNEAVESALQNSTFFTDEQLIPLYAPGPESEIIAFRILAPQLNTYSGFNFYIPVLKISKKEMTVMTDVGPKEMDIPEGLDTDEVTVLDQGLSRTIGQWTTSFMSLPPDGIAHDGSKIYYTIYLLGDRIVEWWRHASRSQYTQRVHGRELHYAFLVLAQYSDGTFRFENAFEDINSQSVGEYDLSPESDGYIYWQYTFDDGRIYVLRWLGIIT